MNYTVYRMNHLDDNCLPKNIDALIFFSTFEERSWNLIEYLHSKGKLPKQVLALNLDDGEKSPYFKATCFESVEFQISYIGTDLSDDLMPCLRNIHSYIKGRNTIGIDISVMPTPIFMQILHFLSKRHCDKKIIIYYNGGLLWKEPYQST